jgi:hypothetical protein
MFAKCIVQSPSNSPDKQFTARQTLLNLVTEKLCLSVRRRKHVVTKFTPNKTLLINDIVRNKTTVETLYNLQFNWLKLDSSYAVLCDIILTLMGVSSDCIICREGRMMFYQSFPSLGQSVLWNHLSEHITLSALWLLCVPPRFNVLSTWFMYVFRMSIHGLAFVVEAKCVVCEVGNDALYRKADSCSVLMSSVLPFVSGRQTV